MKQLPAAPAPAADRWLRRALAAPGWLLDKVEPLPSPPERGALAPSAVYERVRSTARWPEAHLALEPDLHYHLLNGDVLAYQVRRGTAFAIGGLNSADPAALLGSFAAEARQRGLRRLLVFPVRAQERAAAATAGFHSVQVGVEAWLDLADLTFRGRAYESVRQMRNRAARKGVVVAMGGVPEEGADELQQIHGAWLASKRPAWRMKLLVGSPGLQAPFDRRYVVARSDHRVEAFLTLIPGASGQWGVDVMCRRPDAIAGVVEAMIVHSVEALRSEGAHTLSLGPCPMAGVDAGERRLETVFRGLYQSGVGNRVFGFQSLHRFKQKFRPRWEPVYFASSPRLGLFSLYAGCRMWGLY